MQADPARLYHKLDAMYFLPSPQDEQLFARGGLPHSDERAAVFKHRSERAIPADHFDVRRLSLTNQEPDSHQHAEHDNNTNENALHGLAYFFMWCLGSRKPHWTPNIAMFSV